MSSVLKWDGDYRVAKDRRFTLRLDEETTVALRRLATLNERSMAAQLRLMVRTEATKAGVWTPVAPRAVKSSAV